MKTKGKDQLSMFEKAHSKLKGWEKLSDDEVILAISHEMRSRIALKLLGPLTKKLDAIKKYGTKHKKFDDPKWVQEQADSTNAMLQELNETERIHIISSLLAFVFAARVDSSDVKEVL